VDDGVCVTPPAPLRVGTVTVRGVKSVSLRLADQLARR
jgi:hypothetical protein